MVGELRAKYEKGQETLRAAEQKHLEALERVFSESGTWVRACGCGVHYVPYGRLST